jgi:hypothetical protein
MSKIVCIYELSLVSENRPKLLNLLLWAINWIRHSIPPIIFCMTFYFAPKGKEAVYFDTSAVNWLAKDQDSTAVVNRICAYSGVYISAFTVAELAATALKEQRNRLLKITKTISSNWRPLAMPNELLKRSLNAMLSKANRIDASIGSEWDGVWYALNDPDLIDDEAYKEVIGWKAQQEKWYQEMHDSGRPHIQDALAELSAQERHSLTLRPSKILRYFVNHPDYLPNLISEMAIGCGLKTFDKGLSNSVLQLEPWRFFLSGMVYGFYTRSLQRTHFGKQSNPGSIDTQQAIYLSGCSTFVTCDFRQCQMMRWLLPMGHIKRKVWHYTRFRDWIFDQALNN